MLVLSSSTAGLLYGANVDTGAHGFQRCSCRPMRCSEAFVTNPLVSVIVPTYNQLDFIAEALDSVLEQDYENLQIVVGDDGSTDGTVEIIRQFAKRYPRRLIPLDGLPHLGITANCNRCLRACNGKYIAFH